MQDEPMMCYGDELVWDMSCQLFLYTIGSGASGRYQPYAMAHTKYVGVYGEGRLAPYHRLYYVGRLASYAR